MKQLSFLLITLCSFFGVALAQPSFEHWRSYPNGAREISIGLSEHWLLIEPAPGQSAPIAAIEAALLKHNPPLVLSRVEALFGDRLAIEVQASGAFDLQTVGAQLVRSEAATRFWPAVTRETGVGFFDDRFIVAFDGPIDARRIDAVGAKIIDSLGIPGLVVASAHDGDGLAAARALHGQPGIRYAEPDLIRHVKTMNSGPVEPPNDPEFGAQWHLHNVQGLGSIRALDAWAHTTGDPRTVVAIFDTGFDQGHPDLVPNLVGGFDAIGDDDDPEAECGSSPDGAGRAASCPERRPYRESHGTAVSGLVGAVGNNGIGGIGVCPECSLYHVRLLGGVGMRVSTSARAFNRAEREGAWIINNSWGPVLTQFFPLAESEREVFDRITTWGRGGKGVVLVFAAGNDFFMPADTNPYAAHPGVITVAASTQIDDFACYSNYGNVIAIAGPSQGCFRGEGGIGTSDYRGEEGYADGDFTYDFGGTSAASPIIAGVTGLILSANPELTAEQVRLILQRTAEKIIANQNPWEQQFGLNLVEEFAYDERGFSMGFGYGRADAARAVEMALNLPDAVGGLCDEDCPRCVNNRCAPVCESDEACPGAARCIEGPDGLKGCQIPQPAPTDIGQPCVSDCTLCVDAIDSSMRTDRVCSDTCTDDGDCPFGFDCRSLFFGTRACVPGNAECGELWNDVRCQSSIQVSANGMDFCSCECQPNSAAACPDGFFCAAANCRQTRMGLVCEPVAEGRGNYSSTCFPRENYRPVCTSHGQCAIGQRCVEGACEVDTAPEGCDACATCQDDSDCAQDSACVSLNRGRFCAPRCAGHDSYCPGDSLCTQLPNTQDFHCVNPTWQSEGFCPRSYHCDVPGRCFMESDCPEDHSCEAQQCVDPNPPAPDAATDAGEPEPMVDAEVDAAPPRPGPAPQRLEGCQQSTSGSSSALWLLALLPLGLRRRRTHR